MFFIPVNADRIEALFVDSNSFFSAVDSNNAEISVEVMVRMDKYLEYVNLAILDNREVCLSLVEKYIQSLHSRALVESIDYCCCVFRCMETFLNRKFGDLVYLENRSDTCKMISKSVTMHKYNSEIAAASCPLLTALLRYIPQLSVDLIDSGIVESLLFFAQCYLNKSSKLTEIICTCLATFLSTQTDLRSTLTEAPILCSSLVPMLSAYRTDTSTICSIFSLINNLCEGQSQNVSSMMENGLGSCILEFLKECDQAIIIEHIFQCLVHITLNKKWAVHLELSESGLCDVLAFNVKSHVTVTRVIRCWCDIITNLSAVRSIRIKLVDMEVMAIIESALIHDSWEVRGAACGTVSALATDALLAHRLVDVGVCHLLLECLQAAPDRESNEDGDGEGEQTSGCVAAVCAALASLSKFAAAALGERGACQQVLAIVNTYADNARVLAKAFLATRELILNYHRNAHYFKTLDSNVITSALLRHGEDTDVWENGLAALVHVMKKSDTDPLQRMEGHPPTEPTEDTELCNVILRAMKKHKEHRNIVVNACWCVMAVLDTSRNSAKLLARTGLPEAVVEALRVGLKQPRVAERCCDVIRVLATDIDIGEEGRRNLLCAGALEGMTAAMDACSKDAELVRAACVALNLLLTVGQDGALLRDRVAYADTYSVVVRILRQNLSPTCNRRGLETMALLALLNTLIKLDALEQKVDQIGLTPMLLAALEDYLTQPGIAQADEALFKQATDSIHALELQSKARGSKRAARSKIGMSTGVEG